MTQPKIYALIVAAGTGTRVGGEIPKQYQNLAGKQLLQYSAETLAHHLSISGVQVVIHPKHLAYYNLVCEKVTLLPTTFGGETRSESVAAGLEALAPFEPDYVLIHDAARPFLSEAIITALIEKITPDHAVIPVIEVVDTIRHFQDNVWSEMDRTGILRIQTPQMFPFAELQKIYASGAATATDDAALWLAAGHPLTYVTGAEELRKVTTAEDIIWAEKHALHTRRTRTAVGMGFDVHALIPAGETGTIRLGGIDIESAHMLHGHSDADVVLHALVDALLGTVSEGDIGSHFPPTDDRWKGASSHMFIEEARSRVLAHGGVIEHVDVTIIGERPKISPYREAMRASIAQLLHLPLARVSVKATTTEKLGFTGREEGLATQAVATVSLPGDL